MKFNAYLGNYSSFWEYLHTYRNAFEVLFNDVAAKDLYVDRLAHPMLFSARHSLELGLKANIRYLHSYSKRRDFTNSTSHNLKDLFHAFKVHIKAMIENLIKDYGIKVEREDVKAFEVYCDNIEPFINWLSFIDKDSFSFRYPVDVNNNLVFNLNERVDLISIKQALDNSMILLEFTPLVFKKYIDYVDVLENKYKEEVLHSYEC